MLYCSTISKTDSSLTFNDFVPFKDLFMALKHLLNRYIKMNKTLVSGGVFWVHFCIKVLAAQGFKWSVNEIYALMAVLFGQALLCVPISYSSVTFSNFIYLLNYLSCSRSFYLKLKAHLLSPKSNLGLRALLKGTMEFHASSLVGFESTI